MTIEPTTITTITTILLKGHLVQAPIHPLRLQEAATALLSGLSEGKC